MMATIQRFGERVSKWKCGLSGNALLVNAAVAAVRQWRYQPTRLSGEPVEVEMYITVNLVFE
jgi:hypothetical protein